MAGGISSPSEDEITENPTDEENNEGEDVDDETDVGDEGGSSDQDDEEIEGDSNFNFTVQLHEIVSSSTSYTGSSVYESGQTYGPYFNIYWNDENGNGQTWGSTPTCTAAHNVSLSGGSSGSKNASGLSKFSYKYTAGWPRRFAKVSLYGTSRMPSYTYCGMTNSSIYTYATTASSNTTYYLYQNTYSTSQPSNSSCKDNVTGNYYFVFRKNYTLSYNANGGKNAPGSSTMLAAVGKTISTSIPTRTNLQFKEWNTSADGSGTSYDPGDTIKATDVSKNITLYAQWEAVITLNIEVYKNQDNWIGTSYKIGKISGGSNYSGSWTHYSYVYDYEFDYSGDWLNLDYEIEDASGDKVDAYIYLSNSSGVVIVNGQKEASITFQPNMSTEINIVIRQIFEISYNGNGNTGGSSPGVTIKPYGLSVNLASNTYTKTHYNFIGWNTNSNGTGTNYSSGGSYTGNSGTILYAKWEIATYTLTINYYGGTTRQTNTTNLNITASSCTVSSSSIASGGSATVKHTYTTTSYSVVLKLSNSASYDYYLRTGSEPTTSTYTKLYTTSSDSYTYTWKPDSNDTLNIYVKQRYTISYNVNGGSGTLPSTTYKIHGTSATLGTNSLTKTSYTANGWNTNTTGTGTHYASGGSYTTNASDTLYADWTPKTSTIKVQIKTSTNGSSYSNSVTGGTVSVKYYYDNNNTPTTKTVSVTSASATTVATNALVSQTVTFTPSANSGYVFVGISTSSSAPNSSTATTFTPTSSGSTYTINVFFKVLSSNKLKYDSTEKYWYFEHGEYPQSYVGTSMNNTLNSVSPTKSGEIKYNDGTINKTIEVYTYNSKRYARLQAPSTQTLKMSDGTSYTFNKGTYYWFEVEPIRWRVSDYGVSSTSYPSGWSTYGTYKTNFTVVSDRILTIGAVETSDVNEGWAFSSSDMYSNISGLNKTASTTNFSAGITNKQASTGRTYYKFGNAGQQDKVVSVSVTEDGVRVASIEEIDDYLTDYSAKASDMVCFLLGCGTDDKVNYWTRNLGTGLGNGQIVTKAGVTKSTWLDKVQGVRLALTMGNGSRI